MERAYLLLRNNQQSGPFTIGELLQQHLLPSDMIWIEGKSTAWTYLSELELVPFIEKTDLPGQTQALKAPDEIERKAEELRKRILGASPKSYLQNHPTEIETYSSPYQMEGEIEFVDYAKENKLKKNTAVAELLLTCLVIGIFMLGIYKGKSFLGARHHVENSVGTQLNSGDEHAAQKAPENNRQTVAIADTIQKQDSLDTVQKPKQKFLAEKKTSVDSANLASVLAIKTTAGQEKKEETVVQTPPVTKEAVKKDEDDTPSKKQVVNTSEVKSTDQPVKEEKRGFLRGLFKKKKDKGD